MDVDSFKADMARVIINGVVDKVVIKTEEAAERRQRVRDMVAKYTAQRRGGKRKASREWVATERKRRRRCSDRSRVALLGSLLQRDLEDDLADLPGKTDRLLQHLQLLAKIADETPAKGDTDQGDDYFCRLEADIASKIVSLFCRENFSTCVDVIEHVLQLGRRKKRVAGVIMTATSSEVDHRLAATMPKFFTRALDELVDTFPDLHRDYLALIKLSYQHQKSEVRRWALGRLQEHGREEDLVDALKFLADKIGRSSSSSSSWYFGLLAKHTVKAYPASARAVSRIVRAVFIRHKSPVGFDILLEHQTSLDIDVIQKLRDFIDEAHSEAKKLLQQLIESGKYPNLASNLLCRAFTLQPNEYFKTISIHGRRSDFDVVLSYLEEQFCSSQADGTGLEHLLIILEEFPVNRYPGLRDRYEAILLRLFKKDPRRHIRGLLAENLTEEKAEVLKLAIMQRTALDEPWETEVVVATLKIFIEAVSRCNFLRVFQSILAFLVDRFKEEPSTFAPLVAEFGLEEHLLSVVQYLFSHWERLSLEDNGFILKSFWESPAVQESPVLKAKILDGLPEVLPTDGSEAATTEEVQAVLLLALTLNDPTCFLRCLGKLDVCALLPVNDSLLPLAGFLVDLLQQSDDTKAVHLREYARGFLRKAIDALSGLQEEAANVVSESWTRSEEEVDSLAACSGPAGFEGESCEGCDQLSEFFASEWQQTTITVNKEMRKHVMRQVLKIEVQA